MRNCLPALILSFNLIVVPALTQAVYADNIKESEKLYFDLGEDGGWVPFRNAALRGGTSVFEDITIALHQHTGIQFQSINLPQKRAEKALKDGIVDFDFVCLEWFKNGDPGDNFVVSQPLFEVREYLVTLANDTHLYPTRESMFGKPVGTIGGYFYHDDDKFIRIDLANEDRLLKGLKLQRFNVIILDRETAKYWAKLNNVQIGLAALHSSGYILIRLSDQRKQLLPKIDQAFSQMKNSGQLQAILDKHDVESTIFPALSVKPKPVLSAISKPH